MIAAPIPIFGRMPILGFAIKRLKRQGVRPLFIVSRNKDKRLCQHYKADYIEYRNKPIGAKWNAGFRAVREWDPEAVLYIGSDDWISDNWVPTLLPKLKKVDMIGVRGVWYYHRSYGIEGNPNWVDSLGAYTEQLCHWKGYGEDRDDEPIGGGRLISAEILDEFNWEPFDPDGTHNMDWNMFNKVLDAGGTVGIHEPHDIKLMSISSDIWSSMNDYHKMYEESIPVKYVKQFLKKYFKEGLELWNVNGVYSHLK